ncbi:hypothetical protein AMTR_s00056p00204030 [Amborella trichopoda]|uniref:Protein kinase domain-containing protein n=1 Tax=Amborella trichopoda TaxID=13333 RepID=U5CYJ6_AMBTC|nr:hypothetical protein AMTR_s00056p00204030 [Amborella trichopoda]
MSRFGPTEGDGHISTAAVGTLGYVDPEYHTQYTLNEKSDVYGFGIVLLELITGQPAIIINERKIHIVQYIVSELANGAIVRVVDPRLQGEYDIDLMWKAAKTALACTPDTAKQRPNMSTVISELRICIELEWSRLRGSRKEFKLSSTPTDSSNKEIEQAYDPLPR